MIMKNVVTFKTTQTHLTLSQAGFFGVPRGIGGGGGGLKNRATKSAVVFSDWQT